MNSYQQRINDERLARQAPDVQRTAKEIFDALKDIQRYLHWSLDPEDNKDGGAYNVTNLIDNAHALVDLETCCLARGPDRESAAEGKTRMTKTTTA